MKSVLIFLLAVLMIPVSLACAGDVSGDRDVTIEDLLLVVSELGRTVAPGAAVDLNGDGIVNIFDLVLVSRNWGVVCDGAPAVWHSLSQQSCHGIGSCSVSRPDTVQSGDLLVATVYTRNTQQDPSELGVPEGFVSIASSGSSLSDARPWIRTYYKVAGNEPSSYTFSWPQPHTNSRGRVVLARVTGYDSSDPIIGSSDAHNGVGGSSVTVTMPTIGVDEALLLSAGVLRDESSDAQGVSISTSGVSEVFKAFSGNSGNGVLGTSTEHVPSSVTFVGDTSTDRPMAGLLFAIRPGQAAFEQPSDPEDPEPNPERNGLMFESGFETGDLSDFTHESGWGIEDFVGDIVTSPPARKGDYSMQIVLHRDDPLRSNSKRTEIHNQPDRDGLLVERWYAWSVYLPEDYYDTTDTTLELIAQWHATADPGEDGRSPPLQLVGRGGDSDWNWQVRWDSREITPPGNVPEGVEIVASHPVEPGQWHDFVVHVYWSWENDGLLQIWKNGELIVDRIGPNTYNDNIRKGMYWKLGIYKWPWMRDNYGGSIVEERQAYYDEIRKGGPEATYQDMAP